jgi:hypothetical protein
MGTPGFTVTRSVEAATSASPDVENFTGPTASNAVPSDWKWAASALIPVPTWVRPWTPIPVVLSPNTPAPRTPMPTTPSVLPIALNAVPLLAKAEMAGSEPEPAAAERTRAPNGGPPPPGKMSRTWPPPSNSVIRVVESAAFSCPRMMGSPSAAEAGVAVMAVAAAAPRAPAAPFFSRFPPGHRLLRVRFLAHRFLPPSGPAGGGGAETVCPVSDVSGRARRPQQPKNDRHRVSEIVQRDKLGVKTRPGC